MTNRNDRDALDDGKIELVPASEEHSSTLANLMQLYIHDFSEFVEVTPETDGRFGYPQLALYWIETNRRAYLVKVQSRLAGFVLLKHGSTIMGDDAAWDVAEFFILRGERRRGVGTMVAHRVWTELAGRWEVRVLESNRAAVLFWERAIEEFCGSSFQATSVQKDGVPWREFRFLSRGSHATP